MIRKDFVIADDKGNVLCTLRCSAHNEAYLEALNSNKIEITIDQDTKGMIISNNKLKKKKKFRWF